MRKITRFSVLCFMFLSFFAHNGLQAQALMKRVSLQTQIENSDLVVEGKVIAKKSTWDDAGKLIYTINTVEVYKVFKGNALSTVEVITVGGTVGLNALIAHPSLKLRKGDVGVFTLENDNTSFSKTAYSKIKKFKPYGLSQGFYKYNISENLAVTPFVKKQNITSDFYDEIKRLTKTNFTELKAYSPVAKSATSKVFMPPGAITLNKTTVTAGTKDLLTITGTDFGATQGKVEFRDADDGGSSFIEALDSQVIDWTDTQIIVEVPSGAGTGTIRVKDSNGIASPLSSVLTVLYSEINVETDPDDRPDDEPPTNGPIPETAYQLQHVGQNAGGGMTWRMQTDFFNDTEFPGAKDAFMRSFNKWVCETGINWTVGATPTTKDSAGDNTDATNIIRFDNGAELNANTLGICYSWFSGCFSGRSDVDWFVTELDIVFNDDVNWYTGTGTPASNQYDLESVMLHELGHAHQLGHIIDPNNNNVGNDAEDVMHYAFTNGETQRAITVNNSTAANGIQDRSTSNNVCSTFPMVDLACPLSDNDAVLESGINIYPNPAKEEFFIKNNSYLTLKTATLFDLSGRNIIEYDISEGSKLKTINLSKISSGVYFIKIASDEAAITRKLVIE
ncbi:putative secreted protein (Por secretion system target) [Jejuia pallidilutea]|uniref:Putative secreted protein (Por secretion system target) n=1 Tax=Jejuia pallidilutea TaxID=504487 RepID=A0A362X477_9FLAO|nr:T9SS type A sorting domain-containing protein [Jejuia pallidilutea]PQV51695.1 putative secreted protein (Por secretion system target) [Jejuia pallidilutea]